MPIKGCKFNQLVIKGLNVYSKSTVLEKSAVQIVDNTIKNVGNFDFNESDIKVLEFPSNWHLLPGMIDMHVHGAAGADTMDATDAALHKISNALVKEGVTSFLATTTTAKSYDIENALQRVASYVTNKQDMHRAEILGINLEGPFLSHEKPGAQESEQFISPSVDLFKHWQKMSGNLIKIVTVAPEIDGGLELIEYLFNHNIIASMGHSNASYEQASIAIQKGCTYATHLFNGMRGIHHRDPGLVTALLLNDEVTTETIADCVHTHPAMLKLIWKLKGPDKIVLITDAMRAKYLNDSNYKLGTKSVIVKNNQARLANGTLAGSVLGMDFAVRNMLKFTDCTLLDIIKMTSENPAKQLGVFSRKGSIDIGKDADLVVMDENMRVRMTICRGNVLFSV
ncbi:MAG: hypothetical protein AMJ43_03905 [Coxiella sp. DG_40]|nr:MAG: hypothetical protein AMJ43_03905 [Coxiella sp. DG_40]